MNQQSGMSYGPKTYSCCKLSPAASMQGAQNLAVGPTTGSMIARDHACNTFFKLKRSSRKE